MNPKLSKVFFNLLFITVSFITVLSLVGSAKSSAKVAEENQVTEEYKIYTPNTSLSTLVSLPTLASLPALASGCNQESHPGNTVAGSSQIGHWWVSTNLIYRLDFQNDGNLVLYHYTYPCNRYSIWSSKTDHKSVRFMIYANLADLEIINKQNYVVWSAFEDPSLHVKPGGVEPFKLVVQNDGNLVMYDKNGFSKWATGTNGK